MELRSRFAAALLTATLVAGCGGAVPDTTKPVSAPAAAPATPPAPAPAQGQPASPAPKVEAAPTPTTAPATAPTPAEQPAAQAPKAPEPPAATAPANPVVAAPEPAVQTLSFTTLQRGGYSGVTERKAVLVTDEAQWKANWQQTNSRMLPVPPAPAMDFSGQSVLAVYMGEQRTGGYAIEITGVELSGDTLRVTVRQTRPAPGSMVTQALTQPFHMVQIPKVPSGTKVEVNW